MKKNMFKLSEHQKYTLLSLREACNRQSEKYSNRKILYKAKYDKEIFTEQKISLLRMRDELLMDLKNYIRRVDKILNTLEQGFKTGDLEDLPIQTRTTIEDIAYSYRITHIFNQALSKELRCEEEFDSSCISSIYIQIDDFKKTSRFFSNEFTATTNIVTHIAKASESYKKLRFLYDYFSELSHPNYGRHLVKSFSYSYSFDNISADKFITDMTLATFNVLEYLSREYSRLEKSFLLCEYILQRVYKDKTARFTPTALDYFWTGTSQNQAINFIFSFSPFEQINNQYKLMKGVWGLDLSNKRKYLYEDGFYKYDCWRIHFFKKIWFQVDHFPISDFIYESNITGSESLQTENYKQRLDDRNLDSYRTPDTEINSMH